MIYCSTSYISVFVTAKVNEDEKDRFQEYVVSDYCEDDLSKSVIIDKLISEISDDIYRARTQAYLSSLTEEQLDQFHVFCGPKVSRFYHL